MKNLLKYTVIASFLVLFACEEFLDNPPLGVQTLDTFYTDKAEAERGLMAAYYWLSGDDWYYKDVSYTYGDVMSDNSFVGWWDLPDWTRIGVRQSVVGKMSRCGYPTSCGRRFSGAAQRNGTLRSIPRSAVPGQRGQNQAVMTAETDNHPVSLILGPASVLRCRYLSLGRGGTLSGRIYAALGTALNPIIAKH